MSDRAMEERSRIANLVKNLIDSETDRNTKRTLQILLLAILQPSLSIDEASVSLELLKKLSEP